MQIWLNNKSSLCQTEQQVEIYPQLIFQGRHVSPAPLYRIPTVTTKQWPHMQTHKLPVC